MTAVKRLMAWHGMYYKIKPFHDNIDSIKGKQSLCKVLFNKKYTFLATPFTITTLPHIKAMQRQRRVRFTSARALKRGKSLKEGKTQGYIG